MKKIILGLLFFTTPFVFAQELDAPFSPVRTYADIVSMMNRIHQNHPDTTEVFTLGNSPDGTPVYGVKITDPHAPRPVENLVVATHHGNEYGSTEVALAFMQRISEQPLSGQTLYVIPVLNTWGYDRNQRTERDGEGHMVDPNRDYPGPCKRETRFHLSNTESLARFIAERNIVNVATLHTYAELVLYPWGISTDDVDTRYTPQFVQMGNAAASVSHYQVGNSTAALYPADGTFEDFVFWRHGIWSLLFEMGRTHSPDAGQLQQLIADNVPGLIQMFKEAPRERAPLHSFEGHCYGFENLLDLKNE